MLFRSHGKGFKSRPVKLGEKLEVDIVELSSKEEGIAKVQGFVIYVPNAKPGDHVRIRISKVSSMSANGEIIGQN